MLSSILIWSLLPGAVNVQVELPNMDGELAKGDDCETELPAEAAVNEKPRLGEVPLVEPKTTGAVLTAEKEEEDDAPKEKTGGELDEAPKGEEFGVFQLDPNGTEAAPLELAALVSEDEDKVLAPKIADTVPVLELTMPLPEDELAPKLKIAGVVLLLETGAMGKEEVAEELIPKLNVLEEPLLKLNALAPEEAAEAPVPKPNKPDGPLPVSADFVSTAEVEEVRPKFAPELNNLLAGAEDVNTLLLDIKDETPEPEKAGEDTDEPN